MQPVIAGFRVRQLIPADKETLREVAEMLLPHEATILDRWVEMQLRVYRPAAIGPSELRRVFGAILGRMLQMLAEESAEVFIDELDAVGTSLADREFPYEALIMSLHFLEESYMPYLVEDERPGTRDRLIALDEFLHLVLAALATSYFAAFRQAVLGEAEAGRILQEGLMPRIPPTAAGLYVASVYESATEQSLVGGDVLDVFPLTPDTVAFVVADVSGHGVTAAHDSALLRHLFRGFLRTTGSPSESASLVNNVLCKELHEGSFISALMGTCDSSGLMRLVNAGHPRPLICGDECREVGGEGLLLGIVENERYEMAELQLESGDVFLGYTDGLTEARSEGEFFGEQRIMRRVESMRGKPAQVIAEYLRHEALMFTGKRLTDDLAVLILQKT